MIRTLGVVVDGFLVSVATGLVFGLFPALLGSRADLNVALKDSGGPSGQGPRHSTARSLLVVAEVALALILLIGSALLIRTSLALRRVDPGFDSHGVLTMRMSLTGSKFTRSIGVEQMVRDGVARLRALPAIPFPSPSSAGRSASVRFTAAWRG